MNFVHFNLPLSLNAGAIGPGRVIRDIAAAAELPLYWGNEGHYGSDYMGLPAEPADAEIVLALLSESKMHFEVVDNLPYTMRHMAE